MQEFRQYVKTVVMLGCGCGIYVLLDDINVNGGSGDGVDLVQVVEGGGRLQRLPIERFVKMPWKS